jgi:hypothetical protein
MTVKCSFIAALVELAISSANDRDPLEIKQTQNHRANVVPSPVRQTPMIGTNIPRPLRHVRWTSEARAGRIGCR